MGFLKTLAKVLVANLLIVALVIGLYVAFVGHLEIEVIPQHNADVPVVVVTLGELETPLVSQVTSSPPIPGVTSTARQPLRIQSSQTSSSSRSRNANASAARSSAQMCQFWAREYASDQEPQSRIHRESACSRYEALSGNSRTTIVSRSLLSGADASAQRQQQQLLSDRRQALAQTQREQRELQARCDRYNEQLDNIQAELRSGYSVSRGNYLRSLRREISEKYSRECILGR